MVSRGDCPEQLFPFQASSTCECGASSYKHTTIFGRLGPTSEQLVATCAAVRVGGCQRVPLHHLLHEDSSYETERDLGSCVGDCAGKYSHIKATEY